jgi:hypothetical protein
LVFDQGIRVIRAFARIRVYLWPIFRIRRAHRPKIG